MGWRRGADPAPRGPQTRLAARLSIEILPQHAARKRQGFALICNACGHLGGRLADQILLRMRCHIGNERN
jgi:hypothetical protein